MKTISNKEKLINLFKAIEENDNEIDLIKSNLIINGINPELAIKQGLEIISNIQKNKMHQNSSTLMEYNLKSEDYPIAAFTATESNLPPLKFDKNKNNSTSND